LANPFGSGDRRVGGSTQVRLAGVGPGPGPPTVDKFHYKHQF